MKKKNKQIILDDLDWLILQVLQKNAKQPYEETGQQLQVAHSTVYDRIKKMEKVGIIERYMAVINLDKAGVKYITAIMTIFTEPKESESVAEKLKKFNKVLEIFTSLSEELVIIAKVIAEDQEELHSFIAHSVAPLQGVIRIRTSIVTKRFKDEIPFISERGI